MPIDVYNCLTMVETNDEIVAGNFDSVIYRITKFFLLFHNSMLKMAQKTSILLRI